MPFSPELQIKFQTLKRHIDEVFTRNQISGENKRRLESEIFFINEVRTVQLTAPTNTTVLEPILRNWISRARDLSKIEIHLGGVNCLEAHNRFREKLGLNALKHLQRLDEQAAAYSIVLAFLKQKDPTMPLSHSPRSAREYDGENLAMKAEGAPNWEWAVNTEWVAREVLCMHARTKDMDLDQDTIWFPTAPTYQDSGHLTQVVWNKTGWVGGATATFATTGNPITIYVARYFPGGNVQDANEYKENARGPCKALVESHRSNLARKNQL